MVVIIVAITKAIMVAIIVAIVIAFVAKNTEIAGEPQAIVVILLLTYMHLTIGIAIERSPSLFSKSLRSGVAA